MRHLFLFAWVAVVLTMWARVADATLMRVGPSHATYRSGIVADALGPMCFAFEIGGDHLPCQPADIALSKNPHTRVQLYMANNLRLTPEAIEILRTDQSSTVFLESIFHERRSSELQGHIEISSRRNSWGWAVTPFRVYYQSSFYNEALTEARLLAFQEASATLQWGTNLQDDFYLGVQTRAAHRRYVSQSFFLSDAFSESAKGLLQPDHQNLFYVEPGLQYRASNNPWRPRLGATIVNMAITSKVSPFSQKPQAHLAGAIAPDLGTGRLHLGFDLFIHEQTLSAEEALYLGFMYDWAILQTFGNYNQNDWGLGINFPVGSLDFAAAVRRERIEFPGLSTTKDTKASLSMSVNF